MKLVHPSFEICEQGPDLEGIYEAIERAGRTCYKSKRPEGQTAKDFVDRMIASKHYAMLEHGTVYLKVPTGKYSFLDVDYFDDCDDIKDSFFSNPYTRIHCQEGYYYISTNYRVLVENFSEEFISELLQYLCEPTEFHEKRVTVRFITDRGVSHEFVRHRVFSFAQESTRYCNYSKDTFGNELTFIIPSWMDSNEQSINTKQGFGIKPGEELFAFLGKSERHYFKLLELGWTPQQARQVLPNALKTELVMTGFVSDWSHFFDLRARGTTGAPHLDAKALAEPLMHEFINRNYINE